MKKDNTWTYIILGLIGIAIFSFLVFGFSKNDYGHTGFDIVFHQGAGYIITMLLFFALAIGALIYAVRRYDSTQNTSSLIAPAIVGVLFLILAFSKGCTDKANDGVTGPKGRPIISLTK